MTFQEKNHTVSLFTNIFVLGFYLISLWRMAAAGSFDADALFRLWGITIVLVIIFTVGGTILTHIFTAIIEVIRTGEEDPEIEDIADERDKLIDLRGTRASYIFASLGVFLAMLTFAFGRPALTMFALLIFFSLVAQIVGDVSRLVLYRRGF